MPNSLKDLDLDSKFDNLLKKYIKNYEKCDPQVLNFSKTLCYASANIIFEIMNDTIAEITDEKEAVDSLNYLAFQIHNYFSKTTDA